MSAGVANLATAQVIIAGGAIMAAGSLLIPNQYGWPISGGLIAYGILAILIAGDRGKNNSSATLWKLRVSGQIAIPVGVGLGIGQAARAIAVFLYHKLF